MKNYLIINEHQESLGIAGVSLSEMLVYDYENVNMIEAQINEISAPGASALTINGDTTALEPGRKRLFFLLGATFGCLLPVAGTLLSFGIATSNFGQWSGLIIGGATGLVGPPLLTKLVSKDNRRTRYALYGSLTGGAIGILGFGFLVAKAGGWI